MTTGKNITGLPQKIWFLWLQGEQDMPEVVQRCYASWQRYNPDWEITLLTEDNLADYLQVESVLYERERAIPRVSASDIVRINLLAEHGGVWVDATCFCCQPLDSWLPQEMESGFFAFARPGKDRMISSWFMAAKPNNVLVQRYALRVNHFWRSHRDLSFVNKRPWLYKFLRRSGLFGYLHASPSRWFHPLWQGIFKIYPYYWFHYTFEYLYRREEVFRAVWDQTPKHAADAPHLCWNYGLDQVVDEDTKAQIKKPWAPLYKLTWKVNPEMFLEGRTLHYLLYQSGK